MKYKFNVRPKRRRVVIWAVLGCFFVGCAGLSFGLGYFAHRDQLLPSSLVDFFRAARDRHVHREQVREGRVGRWGKYEAPKDASLFEQQKHHEELDALGYLSGYVPASETDGVALYDPERAYAGLNLYSSGHAPEAYLMDMNGGILHQWRYDLEDVWPDFVRPENVVQSDQYYWRRVHLYENGDLLAIFEGIGIIKLDKDSKLLWANKCEAHHDLFAHKDGSISVLTRKVHVVPRINAKKPILEDFVTRLDSGGRIISEISILECFENSVYAPLLLQGRTEGDIAHTNALDFLDGGFADRSPIFREGNILTSMRSMSAIAIIDPDAEQVVWALSGIWLRQHDPSLLDNGNMLLFDNMGNGGHSKAVEFEPFTQEIVWAYGTGPAEPLYSGTCGASVRLPNGNTLITESDNGRALEVTSENEIVWQFANPHRTGSEEELIAMLTEVTRLPLSFPVDWAGTTSDPTDSR